jgi:hypothetical protein
MDAALAGLVILVIGDSQMKGLIYDMHDQLTNNGAVVHSYLMCGATAHDWLAKSTVSCGRGERHEKGAPSINTQQLLPTYSLPELIDKTHPNLVVVELGEKLEPDHNWVRQEVHKRGSQFRSIVALATLDLDESRNNLSAPRAGKVHHGRFLCFEAETRPTLLIGADTHVSDHFF